jgi:hypothetical protein
MGKIKQEKIYHWKYLLKLKLSPIHQISTSLELHVSHFIDVFLGKSESVKEKVGRNDRTQVDKKKRYKGKHHRR